MNQALKKVGLHAISLLFLTALFSSCTENPAWIKNQGAIFGTTYHLVYESPNGKDLHPQVLLSLDSVNRSLSTYDPASVISRFNTSEKGVPTDDFFNTVFGAAKVVTEASNGAFDMTVAPLVNAWGFGFTNKQIMTPERIDSLRNLVGMQYVHLKKDSVVRSRPGVMLDASAIAKGFGVDVAAATLSRMGCTNYMVEIGGEVIASGHNPKNKKWRIGIDKPIPDPRAVDRQLQLILEVSGRAVATSGNYRQFYIDETGTKLAHTIDPATGRPVQHSLLSATILAKDCMHADAYATACMVLGLEKSIQLLNKHPEMEACFIFDTQEGTKVSWTDGFDKYITE
jgi:thiamine biosynthesis lipoprotein